MKLLHNHEVRYMKSGGTVKQKQLGGSRLRVAYPQKPEVQVVTTKNTSFDEDPNLFWGPFMSDPDEINSQTVGGGVATFGLWEYTS